MVYEVRVVVPGTHSDQVSDEVTSTGLLLVVSHSLQTLLVVVVDLASGVLEVVDHSLQVLDPLVVVVDLASGVLLVVLDHCPQTFSALVVVVDLASGVLEVVDHSLQVLASVVVLLASGVLLVVVSHSLQVDDSAAGVVLVSASGVVFATGVLLSASGVVTTAHSVSWAATAPRRAAAAAIVRPFILSESSQTTKEIMFTPGK